jgi:UDP-N-acetylglucosamine:LPS N-acetylglucosamine transferase
MHKKHLFLYLKTGGGHLAPARSLANYIHTKHGDKASASLYDGFTGVNRWVKAIIEDGYRQSQSKAVWIFEILYALNKIPFVARITAMIVSFYVFPHLQKQLLEEKPSRIVVFHFFLIRPVMQILKKNGLDIPVLIVVTDPFTAHPIWFLDKRPRFIVFSERLRNDCVNKTGIHESAIRVFPFILDEKFTRPLSGVLARSMKENLGFDPDKRLVLILGGGDGIPRGKKILKNFLNHTPGAEVAIVCGKNKELYKKAWKIKNKYQFEGLKIYGFVDFVYELINMADVVVTKCGASTFMEILISGKVPIINNYIWEQEKGNMEFVCQNAMGIYEKDLSKLPLRINELIDNPQIYNTYKSNIEKQKLINGTPLVSEFIIADQNQIL